MKLKIWIFALCFAPLALFANDDDFDINKWNATLHEVQSRAIAEGISPRVINAVIQTGEFMPGVVRSDKNQVEFKLTHAQYIARMITPERITSGRRAKTQNAAMLRRVDAEYGVPPHVIAAFWGLESRYGEFKGSHKISDAYLSLIYDGRRGTFFGNQLMALMKIADKNNLEIDDMRGSWAGAMGHFQFIPTTLQQYGVDGDGDGRIDIVNNFADASHSAGNYLSKLGWNKNERILRTVRVPTNFNLSWCDSRTKKTLNEWVAMGITNPDGSAIPRGTREAGMVCDEDSITTTRTAYMVYDNFYRIKKWNNSNAYAVAIALLSDQLR